MSDILHPLLQRQLRRLGVDATHPPPTADTWAQLLQRVSRAYNDADADRYQLERSQDLASQEMAARHQQLQASQARLANLVALSSDWVWETDSADCFTYISSGVQRAGIDPASLLGRPRQVDAMPPVEGHNPAAYRAAVAARQPLRDFIALAEEGGLIVPIGRWVMHAACQQLQAWREAGDQPPGCAINLSPRQFASARLVDDLRDALATHALEGGMLGVEITEGQLMAEPARDQQTLQRLQALGVQVSVDGFGTGDSSLACLRRITADT